MARKNIVVIKNMNAYNHATAPFGPNQIVAVINDARDVGVQLYANQPGSMYFTLPVDHPALPVINPLSQHYFVQKWDGSDYVTIQGGIITDYDAGEYEVVISGVDYITAMNKYYTPLPGPKLGQKAIPDTDETDLSAGHVSSSKYSTYSSADPIYGRAFGTKERNFPNTYTALTSATDTYTNTAAFSIDPFPTAYNSTAPVITTKKMIEHAIKMDKELHNWGTQAPVIDSYESSNGDIRMWSGIPQSGTTPTGKENEVFVDYVTDANGNKTGDIKVSGSIFIFRAASSTSATRQWIDTDTSAPCSMAVAVKNIGIIFYCSPGGPLYVMQEPYSTSGSTDVGDTSEPLQFSVTFRPVTKYDSTTEIAYGFNRVISTLTEGVSYSFAARPFYIALLSTPTTSAFGSYNQYIYGDQTRYSSTSSTSGLKTNNVSNIISSTFSDVMDRTKDYPNLELTIATAARATTVITYTFTTGVPAMLSVGNTVTVSGFSNSNFNGTFTIGTISSDRKTVTVTSGTSGTIAVVTAAGKMVKTYTVLKPIVKFTSLNQINTGSSVFKHPYATAGQGPIDFFNEVAEIEMGSRVDGSKVVFNFYGVPGATPTGDQLIVNHGVSAASQATLIYPGQIRSFNVVNKRSSKVNSVRMVPTTDFLIGASTEGASGGVKSQGIVRMPDYAVSDPALPTILTQGGLISQESAANAGQGTVNDFGTNDDVITLRVELRSDAFGPIGMAGTPKLGETVTVVVRRKSVGVGIDEMVQTYNVGGMEWAGKIDGSESLYLDLVKPNKFVGPAVSWEAKPSPKKEKSRFRSNSEPPEKDKKKKGNNDLGASDFTKRIRAADGTWLPAPNSPAARFLTGTSYMWAPAKPKKSVGLPKPPGRGSTGGGYGQGGGGR